MIEIAMQMILCLLLAALIGFIIGYIFAKLSCEDTDHTQEIVELKDPSLLSAPRNNQKDNLTKIKGVGLKIEEKLNDLGVYHFDQIANWDDDFVKKVDEKLAFSGRIIREDWINQAKVLASGEETDFSKRVESGEVPSSKQA
jgi:NADH-quinone oxidoreductase subunit E